MLRPGSLIRILSGLFFVLASPVPSLIGADRAAALAGFAVGKPAARTVITPIDVSVTDAKASEVLRKLQAASIAPVYRFDPDAGARVAAKLKTFLDDKQAAFLHSLGTLFGKRPLTLSDLDKPDFRSAVSHFQEAHPDFPLTVSMARNWVLADPAASPDASLIDLVRQFFSQNLILEAAPRDGGGEVFREIVVRTPNATNNGANSERTVSRAGYLTVLEARSALISSLGSENQGVAPFLTKLVEPNCLPNKAATAKLRARQTAGVAAPVLFPSGTSIVEKGSPVSATEMEALRKLNEKGLLRSLASASSDGTMLVSAGRNWTLWGGLLILFLAAAVAGWWFWRYFRKRRLRVPVVPPARVAGPIPDEIRNAWLPHLVGVLRERVVQTLFRQRQELIESHHAAADEVEAMEARLAKLQPALEKRLGSAGAPASKVDPVESEEKSPPPKLQPVQSSMPRVPESDSDKVETETGAKRFYERLKFSPIAGIFVVSVLLLAGAYMAWEGMHNVSVGRQSDKALASIFINRYFPKIPVPSALRPVTAECRVSNSGKGTKRISATMTFRVLQSLYQRVDADTLEPYKLISDSFLQRAFARANRDAALRVPTFSWSEVVSRSAAKDSTITISYQFTAKRDGSRWAITPVDGLAGLLKKIPGGVPKTELPSDAVMLGSREFKQGMKAYNQSVQIFLTDVRSAGSSDSAREMTVSREAPASGETDTRMPTLSKAVEPPTIFYTGRTFDGVLIAGTDGNHVDDVRLVVSDYQAAAHFIQGYVALSDRPKVAKYFTGHIRFESDGSGDRDTELVFRTLRASGVEKQVAGIPAFFQYGRATEMRLDVNGQNLRGRADGLELVLGKASQTPAGQSSAQ